MLYLLQLTMHNKDGFGTKEYCWINKNDLLVSYTRALFKYQASVICG